MRYVSQCCVALVLVVISGAAVCAEGPIRFVAEWGTEGDANGQFHSPIGIAICRKDIVYVTDLNNSRVQKFNTDGRYLGGFLLPNDFEDRQSSQSPGIAVAANGLIYISFMLQHKIRVYSDGGQVVREWGKLGNGPGELNGPGGLVVGKDNLLYVCDQNNHRVQIYSTDGKFIESWGVHGSKMGQFGGVERAGSRFGGPHFIARDSRGRLFTTEGANARVQRFSATGKAEIDWGDHGDHSGGFGALHTAFSKNPFGPIVVMVDAQDRVWVSSLNNRIQAFSTDGDFLFGIGTSGDRPGQFFRPHGLAVDSTGHLYVCDSSNHRIQKFQLVSKSIAK